MEITLHETVDGRLEVSNNVIRGNVELPFTIDATTLSYFQSCRRRFLLEGEWRPIQWRAKALFDACLRRGILQLSAGAEAGTVAGEARAKFMQTAADPGLDAQGDTYTLAKDYCAMLSTVLLSVAKLTLLTLKPLPEFHPSSKVGWRFTSHRDDTGTLHRWITVDRWDADELARAMHGWHVIGDMVMSRAAMMLHVIEIGQTRAGRRAVAWARGWRHPAMPSLRMRFRRTDGQDFTGWKPVYLSDMAGGDSAVHSWVEQMWREGAAEPLMHHATIECPVNAVCNEIEGQVVREGIEMSRMWAERGVRPWQMVPMARPACDGLVPCPFQNICYAPDQLVDIESLGMYQERKDKVLA